MPDLAELLGHDDVARQISLDLEDPDARIIRLTGPAGSGKSHIARLVAQEWRATGGRCVVAVGDDEHAWRELYPLLSGLSQTHVDWAGIATAGGRSAAQVVDRALGGTGASTSLFDLLRVAFRQRIDRGLKPYSSLERDVILDLRRLARSRRLLLIADNGQWWDAASLRLVIDLISEPLRSSIPRLDAVVVLLVDTADEQPPVATEAFESLSEKCALQTRRAMLCTREQFPAVLEALGLAEAPPVDVLDALFRVSNGHLKLAEQIAQFAQHNAPGELIGATAGNYASTLLSIRLAELGSSRVEVADLLANAAILGLSFREQALECLVRGRRSELDRVIDRAVGLRFIERVEERLEFGHDVIREAILGSQTPSQLKKRQARMADCLAILQPGNYAARERALSRAGELARAREMAALAAVAQLRSGTQATRVLHQVSVRYPSDRELTAYLRVIAAGYSAVAVGDFANALPGLGASLPGETPVMAAERNYLAAICAMELQTHVGATEAQAILTSWESSLRDEGELWLRCLLLLQQAHVRCERFTEASATDNDIERELLRRRRYDADADLMLHVQHRRAGAVCVPEVAETRIALAVDFFRSGTVEPGRSHLELYRSLNNLAAIRLRLGRDADAHASAQEAERIALDAPEAVPRLDILASNAVLAAQRSGALPIQEAVARQRILIASPEGANDKFLQRCNLVAYLLLAARDDEADDELRALVEELESSELDQTYLVYYARALEVANAAVAGDTDEALRRHAAMDSFVQSLRWPAAPYVRRRQRLLADALPALDPNHPRAALDRVLLDARPFEVGQAWPYYGRLMPCCELSFWLDS